MFKPLSSYWIGAWVWVMFSCASLQCVCLPFGPVGNPWAGYYGDWWVLLAVGEGKFLGLSQKLWESRVSHPSGSRWLFLALISWLDFSLARAFPAAHLWCPREETSGPLSGRLQRRGWHRGSLVCPVNFCFSCWLFRLWRNSELNSSFWFFSHCQGMCYRQGEGKVNI